MKVVISIEHPAWAHQFKSIIKKINSDGEALVLAVDKDGDLKLLDAFGINYIKLADTTGKNVFDKGLLFLNLCSSYTREIKNFKPDILIGRASPMMAIAAKRTNLPHVIFEDTEVSRFSLNICKKYSSLIITPRTFLTDLGEKQLRLPIYKELFYLHNGFSPDLSIVESCGINISKPFAIVRFVAWNASHDIGKSGLNNNDKLIFIKELEKLMPVYIFSEAALPEEFNKYMPSIQYDKIHHLLYYATFVFSEGATMASEAAILGTHAFYLNEIEAGSINEQENRYQLLIMARNRQTRYADALKVAKELIKNNSLWKQGKEKRKVLLKEMPDPNDLFMDKMREYAKIK